MKNALRPFMNHDQLKYSNSVIRARHEIPNRRLKRFSVFGSKFCHNIFRHPTVFFVDLNILHLSIEHLSGSGPLNIKWQSVNKIALCHIMHSQQFNCNFLFFNQLDMYICIQNSSLLTHKFHVNDNGLSRKCERKVNRSLAYFNLV